MPSRNAAQFWRRTAAFVASAAVALVGVTRVSMTNGLSMDASWNATGSLGGEVTVRGFDLTAP